MLKMALSGMENRERNFVGLTTTQGGYSQNH